MKPAIPRSAHLLRWIARIWSLLLGGLILMMFLPTLTAAFFGNDPLPAIDILLISLFTLAALALLLAWRWERIGAWIAIAATLIQHLVFSLSKHFWEPGQLIQAALFILPAVAYLLANKLAAGWT